MFRGIGDVAAGMVRAQVLDDARAAVTRDRAATHGAPEESFGAIARVWSARLGVAVTPAQVCILLTDLKGCRAWANPGHRDNWVDAAGYAACGAEVAGIVAEAVAENAGGNGLTDPPFAREIRHWDNIEPLPDPREV